MSGNEKSKLKLLVLFDILERYTDKTHGINMGEIMERLSAEEITAERKGIYRDINLLREAGYDIIKYKENRDVYYKLASRRFDMPELKMMVDAVVSSRFITEDQSERLIKKLESECSSYESKELQRTVRLFDRPKTVNDLVLNNIGILSEAISEGKKISFEYMQWSVKKTLVKRENGDRRIVSPIFLEFYNDKYYLISYDDAKNDTRHFRVDLMQNVRVENLPVSEHVFDKKYSNQAMYSSSMVDMFDGEKTEVRLLAHKNKVGVIFDKFGTSAVDVLPLPYDKENEIYQCRVTTAVSKTFFGWLLAVSGDVTLKGPDSVKEKFENLCREIANGTETIRK